MPNRPGATSKGGGRSGQTALGGQRLVCTLLYLANLPQKGHAKSNRPRAKLEEVNCSERGQQHGGEEVRGVGTPPSLDHPL